MISTDVPLLSACLESRSRLLYPAVMLALNTGMRYTEVRLLQWKQVDIVGKALTVGKSKTPTGTGRVLRLNARILNVLEMWAAQFPNRQPEHYVFPFEKCGAKGEEDSFGFTAGVVYYNTDPTRPIGDWKEAWEKARKRSAAILESEIEESQPARPEQDQEKDCAKSEKKSKGKDERKKPARLQCRYHDLRHTAITRLLEAGIPYPVVAHMMGWSAATAIRMAKRYVHIGNQALRDAADVLGAVKLPKIPRSYLKESPKSQEARSRTVQ